MIGWTSLPDRLLIETLLSRLFSQLNIVSFSRLGHPHYTKISSCLIGLLATRTQAVGSDISSNVDNTL